MLLGRIELPTSALPRMRSTTELQQRSVQPPNPLIWGRPGRRGLWRGCCGLSSRAQDRCCAGPLWRRLCNCAPARHNARDDRTAPENRRAKNGSPPSCARTCAAARAQARETAKITELAPLTPATRDPAPALSNIGAEGLGAAGHPGAGAASPYRRDRLPTLILLRHGQSRWNLENRFTGWWDVDLTPTRRGGGAGGGRIDGKQGHVADGRLHQPANPRHPHAAFGAWRPPDGCGCPRPRTGD